VYKLSHLSRIRPWIWKETTLRTRLGSQQFRWQCDIFEIVIKYIVNEKKNCCITFWVTFIVYAAQQKSFDVELSPKIFLLLLYLLIHLFFSTVVIVTLAELHLHTHLKFMKNPTSLICQNMCWKSNIKYISLWTTQNSYCCHNFVNWNGGWKFLKLKLQDIVQIIHCNSFRNCWNIWLLTRLYKSDALYML
jgi:hypothetical protein